MERRKVGKIHPKEEEYLTFSRMIYDLPESCGTTFGVLENKSIYPRISIFPGGEADFTAKLFEFGYLDRVYSKPDLSEIEGLPMHLISSIKSFAENEAVYCRFYSITMESQDDQVYFPTVNYVEVEKLRDFSISATGVNKKIPYFNKKWIQTKRALGMKVVYHILKNKFAANYKVLNRNMN